MSLSILREQLTKSTPLFYSDAFNIFSRGYRNKMWRRTARAFVYKWGDRHFIAEVYRIWIDYVKTPTYG